MNQRPKKFRRIVAAGWLLASLLVAGVALANQQLIVDHVRAWQYEPQAEMAELRQRLQLTPEGELYFNTSHAQLEPAKAFNTHCRQSRETNNPIVGCYTNQRIFVFDIDNPKLAGIKEVTAAHELLHAAHERLSEAERQRLAGELRRVYQKVKTPELEKRMAYYEKTQPGEEANELYAILGTEQRTLSPMLEEHYRKYFKDRSVVVDYHDAYNDVFVRVSSELKRLEASINNLAKTTNQRIQNYNQTVSALKADISAFESKNNARGFRNQAEFDQARAGLVARQTTLDGERSSINAQIAKANTLRKQYNQLVEEYNQLNTSINSSLTPIEALK